MSLRIYGNRTIKTLPGEATRPTASRVREALFNIWQGRVDGCRWLDVCAGSGAMGAEALCRGAAEVVG
ncbi:MAG TPA: RsmD family RNA methyltransferase, partial [Trichocoleus sp.]